MKEKELAKFVDWLVQSGESPEGASFDETVSWINELATSEEGQQILGRLIKTYKNKEMGIFKEGGKLNYLLCLKKGGAIQDCGCGKKIEKSQPGGNIAKQRVDGPGIIGKDVEKNGTEVTYLTRPGQEGSTWYTERYVSPDKSDTTYVAWNTATPPMDRLNSTTYVTPTAYKNMSKFRQWFNEVVPEHWERAFRANGFKHGGKIR